MTHIYSRNMYKCEYTILYLFIIELNTMARGSEPDKSQL